MVLDKYARQLTGCITKMELILIQAIKGRYDITCNNINHPTFSKLKIKG